MKYPSLQTTNLIVIDGRNANDILRVVMTGAMLAISDRFDGHVLVLASSNKLAATYESIGESAGLDFFFHGESVDNSDEFLALCAGAVMVMMPSTWPTQQVEMAQLQRFDKVFVLSDEVAATISVCPEARIVKKTELNALKVRELIMGIPLKTAAIQ